MTILKRGQALLFTAKIRKQIALRSLFFSVLIALGPAIHASAMPLAPHFCSEVFIAEAAKERLEPTSAHPAIDALGSRLIEHLKRIRKPNYSSNAGFELTPIRWHRFERLVDFEVRQNGIPIGNGYVSILGPRQVQIKLRFVPTSNADGPLMASKILRAVHAALPHDGILILENFDPQSNRILNSVFGDIFDRHSSRLVDVSHGFVPYYKVFSAGKPRDTTPYPRIIHLLFRNDFRKVIAVERPFPLRYSQPYLMMAVKNHHTYLQHETIAETWRLYRYHPPLRILNVEKAREELLQATPEAVRVRRWKENLFLVEPRSSLRPKKHEVIDALHYSRSIKDPFVFVPTFKGNDVVAFDGVVIAENRREDRREDRHHARVSLKRYPIENKIFNPEAFDNFLFRELSKIQRFSFVEAWIGTVLSVRDGSRRVITSENRLRTFQRNTRWLRTIIEIMQVSFDQGNPLNSSSRLVIELTGGKEGILEEVATHVAHLKTSGQLTVFSGFIDQVVVMKQGKVINFHIDDPHSN